MIGCIVEIHDEAKNGGALYIISFGQIKLFPDSALTFEKNEGQ